MRKDDPVSTSSGDDGVSTEIDRKFLSLDCFKTVFVAK
jgi:hypothetical protein